MLGHFIRRTARVVSKVSLYSLGVGGVSYAGLCYYDEGTRRSAVFWSQAFPPFLHYKIVEWQVKHLSDEEKSAAYKPLHKKYAPVAEHIVLSLKGFYLKQAQLMSTRDDFLPKEYLEFCKRMQDEVPSEYANGQARDLIDQSLQKFKGKRFQDVFSAWEEQPLGAASIGEVHKARLKNGDEVVVKLQYEGIEEKFRSDMTTCITFCKLAMPQHVKPMQEIEKQFVTEFDYEKEAQNLSEIRQNIMKVDRPRFRDMFEIPQPYPEFCTKTVLVMSYLHGTRLDKGVRRMFEKVAKDQGKTLEELEQENVEMFQKHQQDQMVHKEANTASITNHHVSRSFFSLPQSEALKIHIQRLKFSVWRAMVLVQDVVLHNSWRFLYNLSVAPITGTRKPYAWTELPINLADVLYKLNEVHAWQIFMDGAFNGDPHPGNLLLCNNGKIGLIDYGQVKHISRDKRKAYANLILALAEDDREEIVRVFTEEMGMKSKKQNRDIAYRLAVFWNDRDSTDITKGMNIAEFLDWAEAEDPVAEMDEDYVMPARVSVMMRGMGNAFGLRMRTAPLWKPIAEQYLRELEDCGN